MKIFPALCPLTLALALAITITPALAQTFEVTAPASVSGFYDVATAAFGPRHTGFSGPLVQAVGADGSTTACGPIVSDVAGAVALIDRGGCAFVEKALAAQAAGAIGAVICNNDATNPDEVVQMNGSDGCQLAIPVLMLSYNNCQYLRMESGLMVSYTPPALPLPGYSIDTAIPISEGVHNVDGIPVTNGATFSGATGEFWYVYTPQEDGLLNISSCSSAADNRLILAVSPGACTGALQIVDFALSGDNSCTDGPGAGLGADLGALVLAGLTYYLIWDNAEGGEGFDFTLTLSALPQIGVTFNVNMRMENVPPGGVNMVYAAPGTSGTDEVSVVPMADADGDGVWSATLSLTSLDTIGYAFVNGPADIANLEIVPDGCGLPSGFGFNIRPLVVFEIEDVVLDTVCFGLCSGCTLVAAGGNSPVMDVKIFPNPAGSLLHVDIGLPAASEKLGIRLANSLGQPVYERYLGSIRQGNVAIDVGGMPAGIYFLQLADGRGMFTQAVVVQKD